MLGYFLFSTKMSYARCAQFQFCEQEPKKKKNRKQTSTWAEAFQSTDKCNYRADSRTVNMLLLWQLAMLSAIVYRVCKLTTMSKYNHIFYRMSKSNAQCSIQLSDCSSWCKMFEVMKLLLLKGEMCCMQLFNRI